MTSPTPSEPRTGHQLYHGAPLTPVTAVKVVVAAIVTIYAVQIVLASLGALDIVASLVSNLVVIGGIVVFARRRGMSLATFGLRRVSGRFVVAGLLVGIAAWYVTLRLVLLLRPPGDSSELQAVIEQMPLAPTLFVWTLVPALAEELVFRGVLTRSLAGRFYQGTAVVLSAAVFGIYHRFPPQMVSTFALGLALGFLTLRASSIVPAMIVHTLNNAIAILLARDELPAVGVWIGAHPTTMLIGSLILVGCGLALAAKEAT